MLQRWLAVFVLLTWLLPPPVSAAIAEIASAKVQSGDTCCTFASVPVTLGAAVNSGDLITLCGVVTNSATGGSTVSVSSVTDNLSTPTTYTVVNGTGNSAWMGLGVPRPFMAYGKAVVSGTPVITVTPSQATTISLSFEADAFSGTDSTPLDVDGGSSSTNTSTAPTDSLTTNYANSVIVAVTTNDDASGSLTFTVPTSFTRIGQQTGAGNAPPHDCAFRIVTTATSYSATWTLSAAKNSATQTIAYRPVQAAPRTLLKLKN